MDSRKRNAIGDVRGKQGHYTVEVEHGEAIVFIDWNDGTEDQFPLEDFVNLVLSGPFYYPPSD